LADTTSPSWKAAGAKETCASTNTPSAQTRTRTMLRANRLRRVTLPTPSLQGPKTHDPNRASPEPNTQAFSASTEVVYPNPYAVASEFPATSVALVATVTSYRVSALCGGCGWHTRRVESVLHMKSQSRSGSQVI